MKRGFSVAAGVLLSVGLLLMDSLPSLSQTNSLEYQVKAVYLFNFAKFVEWPREAFSNPKAQFTICLAGGDPFGDALEKTIEGETVHGRSLVVRRMAAAGNPNGCHILYMPDSDGEKSAYLLNSVSKRAVLTVGETREFIINGGMIRFVENGQRIRFEINPDAAERGSLKVSSRLLRLADIVRPRQRASNP
jgi:hypothetical protein